MRARVMAPALALGLAALAVRPPAARAEAGNFGLGLIIGSPTGLSVKYYLDRRNAIDAAVGVAVLGSHGIHAHADYLWHPWVLTREPSFDLAFYFGLGGRVLEHNRKDVDDHFHLGARAPAGLVFDFAKGNVPIDVFVEGALILDFIMDDEAGRARGDEGGTIDLDFNVSLGVRYYF